MTDRSPGWRRAVSVTLGYVLTLAIASLLVTGLLIAGGNFVADQREEVIRSELEVIGQQIAASLQSADSLVQASEGSPIVRLENRFPRDVTGSTYHVHLVEGPDPELVLNSTDPDVSVRVAVANETAFGQSHADGGTVVIVYDSGADEVILDDA